MEKLKKGIDQFKKPPGILKLVEFIVSIVIIALSYGSICFNTVGTEFKDIVNCNRSSGLLVYLMGGGNFLVLLFFLTSAVFNETQIGKDFITEIVFDVMYAILDLCAGIVVLAGRDQSGGGWALGVFFLIMTILLVVDAVLLFMNKDK